MITPARRPARSSGSTSLREALHPFVRRFSFTAVYFLLLLAVGAAGYVWIERWPWVDALYMAAMTVSSVGYGEVHPLSSAGRAFSMGLIAAGVVGLGVLWALITAMVVELDLGGLLRRRRVMNTIEGLSGHYIVCGAGRMGRVIIEEMLSTSKRFVVIERDATRVTSLQEDYPGLLLVEGDATREQTLRAAGVERARGLAACLPGDADNLLLCLTAHGVHPPMEIVARAHDEESLVKLRRAGATHAISPTVTGAVRMAATLLRPSVVSFLDAATVGPDITLRLEDADIPAGSPLVGKTLADARIPQHTGLIVLSLRRRGGTENAYNPGPETRLQAGDVMIVLGSPDQVQRLRDYASAGKLNV